MANNEQQQAAQLDTELLRLWFQSVDTDNSNSINADELQVALQASNLRFPKSIVVQMIRMYDVDQNGAMSFEEFTSLHNFLNTVHSAFSNVARSQQSISLNEVYMALHQAGFSLDQPSFLTTCQRGGKICIENLMKSPPWKPPCDHLWSPTCATCKRFDSRRSEKFEENDFISICIFLQSAKNLFTAFDTTRQGRISLDYNQFVYCGFGEGADNMVSEVIVVKGLPFLQSHCVQLPTCVFEVNLLSSCMYSGLEELNQLQGRSVCSLAFWEFPHLHDYQ